jgi:hypothetical protein
MRSDTNLEKIRKLMHELGMKAKGPGKIYLTGGASADLIRYPSIKPEVFRVKVRNFIDAI